MWDCLHVNYLLWKHEDLSLNPRQKCKNHVVEDEGILGLEKSWLACLSKIVGSRLYESSYLKNKMDNNRRQLILTSFLHKCSQGHLYELFRSYINNMVQHYFHKWIQFTLTLIDFFYPLFCFRIYFTYQPQFPSLPSSSFPSTHHLHSLLRKGLEPNKVWH